MVAPKTLIVSSPELLSNEVSLALTQKKSAKDALNDAVKQINASRS